MSWVPLGWFGAIVLGGAMLLGLLTPIAWAQPESTPDVHVDSRPARPSVMLVFDDGTAEVLVSEVVVGLGGILGGGLLLGGLAASDLWHDRRDDQ